MMRNTEHEHDIEYEHDTDREQLSWIEEDS